MRHSLLIVLAVMIPMFSVVAQSGSNSRLSKAGQAQWKAAEAIEKMASTPADQEQVAKEYELVLNTDPNYAPALLKLGKIYRQIGLEKGESAFKKSEGFLNRYQQVAPQAADEVNEEMALLNAYRRKFDNGPAHFVGKWGYEGVSSWVLDVSYNNGTFSYKINDDWGEIEKIEPCAEGVKYYMVCENDRRSYIQSKGWKRLYDDCDSKAKSGFPTSGVYYYDKIISKCVILFTLSGKAPIRSIDKFESYYYLNGNLTYAEDCTREMQRKIVLVKK